MKTRLTLLFCVIISSAFQARSTEAKTFHKRLSSSEDGSQSEPDSVTLPESPFSDEGSSPEESWQKQLRFTERKFSASAVNTILTCSHDARKQIAEVNIVDWKWLGFGDTVSETKLHFKPTKHRTKDPNFRKVWRQFGFRTPRNYIDLVLTMQSSHSNPEGHQFIYQYHCGTATNRYQEHLTWSDETFYWIYPDRVTRKTKDEVKKALGNGSQSDAGQQGSFMDSTHQGLTRSSAQGASPVAQASASKPPASLKSDSGPSASLLSDSGPESSSSESSSSVSVASASGSKSADGGGPPPELSAAVGRISSVTNVPRKSKSRGPQHHAKSRTKLGNGVSSSNGVSSDGGSQGPVGKVALSVAAASMTSGTNGTEQQQLAHNGTSNATALAAEAASANVKSKSTTQKAVIGSVAVAGCVIGIAAFTYRQRRALKTTTGQGKVRKATSNDKFVQHRRGTLKSLPMEQLAPMSLGRGVPGRKSRVLHKRNYRPRRRKPSLEEIIQQITEEPEPQAFDDNEQLWVPPSSVSEVAKQTEILDTPPPPLRKGDEELIKKAYMASRLRLDTNKPITPNFYLPSPPGGSSPSPLVSPEARLPARFPA